MSDFTNIQYGTENYYARDKSARIFITSTHANTNAWTGTIPVDSGITSYYNGLTIDYYVGSVGSEPGNVTLQLYTEDSVGLLAKGVYLSSGTQVTTEIKSRSVVRLTFYNDKWIISTSPIAVGQGLNYTNNGQLSLVLDSNTAITNPTYVGVDNMNKLCVPSSSVSGINSGTGISVVESEGVVTINHSNSVSATSNTPALYSIAIDEQGHIKSHSTNPIDLSGFVPNTRTINDQSLSEDIILTPNMIGAAAADAIPTQTSQLDNTGSGNNTKYVTTTNTETTTDLTSLMSSNIQSGLVKSTIVDLIYPVGSIYISTNSTSPATLFGGDWSPINGRFLLSQSTTYAAGSTGGAATVTLSAAQSGLRAHTHAFIQPNGPSHTHGMDHYHNLYVSKDGVGSASSGEKWTPHGSSQATSTGAFVTKAYSGSNIRTATDSAGTGKCTGGSVAQVTASDATAAHNNMPPYLSVYMWSRIA